MIPSVVAHEVARTLRDFLATGFGPSNAPLAHVLDDFLAEQENLVKGPYLSITLPPKLAPDPQAQVGVELATAQRLCGAKRSRTFSPDEVVRALPHLNASTVRTHVVSRCCVNAPKNHAHRWPYFKRLRRGVYEIRGTYYVPPPADAAAAGAGTRSMKMRCEGRFTP